MSLALRLEFLVPHAHYVGSLTDNTEESYHRIVWQDSRTKPTYAELMQIPQEGLDNRFSPAETAYHTLLEGLSDPEILAHLSGEALVKISAAKTCIEELRRLRRHDLIRKVVFGLNLPTAFDPLVAQMADLYHQQELLEQ